MAKITYVEFDGISHVVDVASGNTVMQGAMDNGIRGIVAECGGGLSCATCVCAVAGRWLAMLGPASEMEYELLQFGGALQEGRRLSCQIVVSDDLDGLVVRLPEAQY